MGIGHEAFEARYARELAWLRETSQTAAVIHNTYINEALGLAFVLPQTWTVRDLREVERIAEGRLLSSHEELFNEAFRSLTTEFLPLVVISAPELDDASARVGPHAISPVVAIHLEAGPEAACGFDLWNHVAIDLAHFHGRIEDYRLLHAPTRTTLSGCDAIEYSAEYTYLHADAVVGCTMRERTYYVLQDRVICELRMCDFPKRDPRLEFGYDEFVQQVCFR